MLEVTVLEVDVEEYFKICSLAACLLATEYWLLRNFSD